MKDSFSSNRVSHLVWWWDAGGLVLYDFTEPLLNNFMSKLACFKHNHLYCKNWPAQQNISIEFYATGPRALELEWERGLDMCSVFLVLGWHVIHETVAATHRSLQLEATFIIICGLERLTLLLAHKIFWLIMVLFCLGFLRFRAWDPACCCFP